jgi:hypothetical protein
MAGSINGTPIVALFKSAGVGPGTKFWDLGSGTGK